MSGSLQQNVVNAASTNEESNWQHACVQVDNTSRVSHDSEKRIMDK